MKDSQINPWNEWANYVLDIIKKHDGNITKIEEELKQDAIMLENMSQTKVEKKEYNEHIIDYTEFKTKILTQARNKGALWGVITGLILAALQVIAQIIFR